MTLVARQIPIQPARRASAARHRSIGINIERKQEGTEVDTVLRQVGSLYPVLKRRKLPWAIEAAQYAALRVTVVQLALFSRAGRRDSLPKRKSIGMATSAEAEVDIWFTVSARGFTSRHPPEFQLVQETTRTTGPCWAVDHCFVRPPWLNARQSLSQDGGTHPPSVFPPVGSATCRNGADSLIVVHRNNFRFNFRAVRSLPTYILVAGVMKSTVLGPRTHVRAPLQLAVGM